MRVIEQEREQYRGREEESLKTHPINLIHIKITLTGEPVHSPKAFRGKLTGRDKKAKTLPESGGVCPFLLRIAPSLPGNCPSARPIALTSFTGLMKQGFHLGSHRNQRRVRRGGEDKAAGLSALI